MIKIKTLLLISIFSFSGCLTSSIHKETDNFENTVRFKLKQTYHAKKEFRGNQYVIINYYKTINTNKEELVYAKLFLSSSPENGKLNDILKIKTNNQLYSRHFYDINTREINESEIITEQKTTEDIDKKNDKKSITKTYTSTITNSTRITNLVYFDITSDLIKNIIVSKQLSFRFYMGKENITINFNKAKLNKLKKFLSSK